MSVSPFGIVCVASRLSKEPGAVQMVKLLYIVTPKLGMSRDEFQRYWLEIQAPIVREIPHLERYVINGVRLARTCDFGWPRGGPLPGS